MIIVTSGCSFTNCGMSWPYHIKDHEVHNMGTVGAGNSYISRAIIYECDRLLKSGITSDNIYPMVMWSGIDRFEFLSTSENPLHDDYTSGDKNRWWLSNYVENVDDSIWLKSSIPDQRWENVATNELMKTYWKYLYDRQQSFLLTLESILKVQNYFKLNGFNYKLSCWQNIFNHYNFTIPNGFNRQGDTLSANEMWTMTWLDNTHWKNNRYWPQEIDYPISKGTPLLKDLYKQTTHLWDMIDFDKFWFYEDEQVEYGGLAEWVLLSEKDNWGMEHDPAHPSEYSHEKFADKIVRGWLNA